MVKQDCRASGLTTDLNRSIPLASANPTFYATCIKGDTDIKTCGLEDLCVMLQRSVAKTYHRSDKQQQFITLLSPSHLNLHC